MIHVRQLAEVQLQQPAVVSIGVFDGVHLGHQALIKQVVQAAQQDQRQTVVITFYPHPDVVLGGIDERYYLTTPDQRATLMHALGVDIVITHPFDDAIRHIRAADFVDQLKTHLNMAALWVGQDFALGYQREGNISFLREQGQQKDFHVQTFELVEDDDSTISSSNIRTKLRAGNIAQANAWLGRAYSVQGEVVHGDKRGRTIGFPTANINVWDKLLIPANGVYAGWVRLNDDTQRFQAVTNVGIRPTFAGHNVTVEAHILDFNREIYGQTLTFSFEKRLRNEQKFSGLDALKAQLARDIQAGREFLSNQTR